MGDFVFNVAKGHVSEFANRVLTTDPANAELVVVLLKNSVADGTAEDLETLTAVLGDGGTDETTSTNYARKLTPSDVGGLGITIDHSNNRVDLDVDDITWTALGNGTADELSDLLFCYDPDSTGGDDDDLVPCTQHDFVIQTDGSDVTAQVTNFFRAS